MRVCGVEIKSNEAIVCLLSLADDVFQLPDCRAKRITLENINSTKDLRYFQFSFSKLMTDYQVDKVVIKERPMKGKFAGGAVGFKLESAIQLIDDLDVETISANRIKASIKRTPVHIPFTETGLKGFQEQAFVTAFAFLNAKYLPAEI
jgi:hypothetical protein